MADEAYKLNQINEAIKNLANFYNNYETIDTKKFDPKNLLDLLIMAPKIFFIICKLNLRDKHAEIYDSYLRRMMSGHYWHHL